MPAPPPCTSTDTVGLRRDQLRRRIGSLHWLAGAIGAGITVFAAIKLSEGRAGELPLMYLGAGFLTVAIFSAAAVGFCLIRLQWQYDLLNRYIASTSGGQYYGTTAPIEPQQQMREAWPVLRAANPNLDDRDCDWPLYEQTGYVTASILAIAAGFLLLAYLWVPILMARSAQAGNGGTGVESTNAGDDRLHASVFFESGLSTLSRDAERSLRDAIKGVIPLSKGRCVLIEGHTDDTASAEYNLAMGRMRAEHVLSIVESEGVRPTSVVLRSFGESHPAASGHSPTAFAQNRRVEMSLTGCAAVAAVP